MPPKQASAEQPPAPPAQPPASPIDLHQLAERVYRLMLADLRLEQARGVGPRRKER